MPLWPVLWMPSWTAVSSFAAPFSLRLSPWIPYQLRKSHPELKIAVITFASYVGELPMKDRSRIGISSG